LPRITWFGRNHPAFFLRVIVSSFLDPRLASAMRWVLTVRVLAPGPVLLRRVRVHPAGGREPLHRRRPLMLTSSARFAWSWPPSQSRESGRIERRPSAHRWLPASPMRSAP